MVSGYCKAEEHQYCTRRLKTPVGKIFKCQCDCHKAQEAAEIEELRRRKALAAEEDEEA